MDLWLRIVLSAVRHLGQPRIDMCAHSQPIICLTTREDSNICDHGTVMGPGRGAERPTEAPRAVPSASDAYSPSDLHGNIHSFIH